MPISLVRIDDRVIHGQIVARWSRWKPCNGILIADDKIANDPIQTQIFSNAVPSNIKVGIYTIKDAVGKINKAKEAKNSYFLIVKSPAYLKKLLELGAEFGKDVNVGPMSSREDTIKVGKNCAITNEEKEAFDFLNEQGINISFQLIPEETPYNWEKARRNII